MTTAGAACPLSMPKTRLVALLVAGLLAVGAAATAPLASAQAPAAAAAPAARNASAPVRPGVVLAGRMGDKALLVIEGRTQVLAPGQAVAGLRFVRWDEDQALLDQRGQSLALRLGAAPASLEPVRRFEPLGQREVVIPVGAGGHFLTDGSINGHGVRFMVDTGATLVSLSRDQVERLGVDLRNARHASAQTAGGMVPVQLVTLSRLQVGEIELVNVPAVVTPTPMPFVLLGNSVLGRFQMRRENDVMRLELR